MNRLLHASIFGSLALFASPAAAQVLELPIKLKTNAARDWSKYHKIAIGDFVGQDRTVTPRALDISEKVGQAFFKQPTQFTVFDRNRLEGIMKEQKIQHSGAFDESTAVQLGKLIGADLMLVGRVQQDQVSNSNNNGRMPSGMRIAVNTTYYVLTVNVMLIDPKTGATIDQFPIETSIKDSKVGVAFTPGSPQHSVMQMNALNDWAAKFDCMVNPCETTEIIKLKSDPSFKKDLESAVARANIDEPEEAVRIIKEVQARELKPAAKHKATYNYGLILLAQGQCKEALALFKEAYLANADSEDYKEAFDKAKGQCSLEDKGK
jgi:tetratricopeptide (TPR) repeat protein